MSFLYQALIKEQQKGQAPDSQPVDRGASDNQPLNQSVHSTYQPQQAFHMASHAAPEQQKSSHWFWLVIAGLLMLVGLLAGYLFASKTNTSPSEQQLYTNIQQQTQLMQELVQEKQQQAEQSVPAMQASAVEPEVEDREETSDPSQDTQIAVAVDEDGQLQTHVQTVNEQSDGEGEPLVRTVLPELPMEDIPDALKSSFESAVKATEQKQDPELFEAHVSTGSSLPLISELPLSQIYWAPDIEYQMHIYASEPSERWIRINDQTLNEGDTLIDNLVLLEIRQDQIIWQSDNKRFAQNALEDFVKQ